MAADADSATQATATVTTAVSTMVLEDRLCNAGRRAMKMAWVIRKGTR